MKLVLCSTLKKENSTLRPNVYDADGFSTELLDVKFRSPVSMHSPSFIVRMPQGATSTYLSNVNYAGFFESDALLTPDWYLWVDDIVSNPDGTWTISTHVDVLAQHKDEILSSTTYVLRSASTNNPAVVDATVPAQLGETVVTSVTPTPIFNATFVDGTYVVGLMNDDSAAIGIPHYYAMSYSEWTDFTSGLLSGVDWAAIDSTEVSVQLQKALINPLQYITSAMWLPCPVHTTSCLEEIPLGFWTIPTGTGACRVSGTFSQITFQITLPSHPQAANFGFTAYPPYSTYKIVCEPFGEITMPGWVRGGDVLDCLITVDPCTGDGILEISTSGNIVGRYYAKVGVQMPIGQLTADVEKIGQSGAIEAAVGAVLEQFAPAGTVGGAVSGILGNIGASITSVQTGGSRGSIAAYSRFPYVQGVFKLLSDTDYNPVMGMPLCNTVQLSSLAGYTLCAYGNVRTTASPEEKARISAYLTGGFFIE